jgi:hypothetical protein
MAELVDASDSKSGYRKVVQVRFLFRALGFQPIKKETVLLPFFICKQFANRIFGGGEKELLNEKMNTLPCFKRNRSNLPKPFL